MEKIEEQQEIPHTNSKYFTEILFILKDQIKDLMSSLLTYTHNELGKLTSNIVKQFQDSYTRYFLEDYVGAILKSLPKYNGLKLKQVKQEIVTKYHIDQLSEQDDTRLYQDLIRAYQLEILTNKLGERYRTTLLDQILAVGSLKSCTTQEIIKETKNKLLSLLLLANWELNQECKNQFTIAQLWNLCVPLYESDLEMKVNKKKIIP